VSGLPGCLIALIALIELIELIALIALSALSHLFRLFHRHHRMAESGPDVESRPRAAEANATLAAHLGLSLTIDSMRKEFLKAGEPPNDASLDALQPRRA